jgi:hypothetical protein
VINLAHLTLADFLMRNLRAIATLIGHWLGERLAAFFLGFSFAIIFFPLYASFFGRRG